MWPFNRLPKLVQSLGKAHPYTKDIPELMDSKYKFVFLCDDTQRGFKNHHIIEGNSKEICRGFTQKPMDYRVSRYNAKALPFSHNTGNRLKVKGKLYAVETWKIPALDNHYKNGVEFSRCKTNIIIVDRDHRVMSIGNETFLQRLPPGMIKTVPELGIRHYTSRPLVGILEAYMYVAMRVHWDPDENHSLFPNPMPTFPPQELVWLPKYYRYPVDRNRKE